MLSFGRFNIGIKPVQPVFFGSPPESLHLCFMNFRSAFLFLLLVATFTSAVGQQANSPYSRFGVGDLLIPASTASQGMAGMGVSYYNPVGINLTNPALLTANSLTVFEGSASAEEKILSGATGEQRDFLGNLDYLAFNFPIARRFRLGMGVQPYSRVNYESVLYSKIEGINQFAEYTYKGTGGITQGYFSGAVLIGDGLSLGAQAFYNFGSATSQSLSRILGNAFVFAPGGQTESVQLTDRVTYNDVSFKVGAHYRYRLPNNVYLNAGATFAPQTDISAKRYRALEAVNYSEAVIVRDTLVSAEAIAPRLPERITLGFSVQKPINEAGRSRSPVTYALGADVSWQDWSMTKDVNFQAFLDRQFRISLGGEITPNIVDATASYLNKITYRAGLRYDQTPFAPEGASFIERSVTLGFSLPNPRPANRYQGYSRLNLALSYGQRSADGQALSETFYRVQIGLSVQQPWFFRRRYD